MRTTWNGSISFGLVNIPVGLAPATAPSARQSDVQFRMLHRECLTPIKQKRWCPFHDVEVGPDEIVRGWEIAKGQFVPVEDEELEALEQLDTSTRDRDHALRPRRTRSTRSTSTAPTTSCPAAYRGAAAARTRCSLEAMKARRRRPRLVRARRQGKAVPDPAEGRRARARDAVRGRGRQERRTRSTRRSPARR